MASRTLIVGLIIKDVGRLFPLFKITVERSMAYPSVTRKNPRVIGMDTPLQDLRKEWYFSTTDG